MKDRLVFLDCLRGCAALYVLLYHVELSPHAADGVQSSLHRFVAYGGSGVTLFFVLSAFSLCLTFPRHEKSGLPLTSFFLSRFFRIAPLFYVLLAFSYFRVTELLDGRFPIGHTLTSLSFTFNLFPKYVASPVWGGWTIGVEMLFYALFPMLYAYGRTLRKKVLLLCVGSIVYLVFHSYGHYFISEDLWPRFDRRTLLHHLPSFLVGMIAFDLYMRMRDSAPRPIGWLMLASGCGLLFAMMYSKHAAIAFIHEWGDALAYALILLGAALARPFALENPVLAYFGKISFSVYLWHLVVIWANEPVYAAIYAADIPVDLKYLNSVLITLAAVTVVSHLSYKLIELPGIRLGRKFFDRVAGMFKGTTPTPEHRQVAQSSMS